MNLRSRSLLRCFAAFGLAALSGLVAAEPTPQDDYPLTTCVVSDEPLGSMGEAERYVHQEPGKEPRVVYFCCGGCLEDFQKSPATFLAKIDAAEKARQTKPAKEPAPKSN